MTEPAGAVGPWRLAYWALLGLFVLTAGLNMLHVHGGFLTNHGADLVVPALLYVVTRRYPELSRAGSVLRIRHLFGRTPESAALWIFTGSVATELSQRYWPHGLFPGTFDPLDIAAYAVGVGSCYLADRSAPPRGLPAPSPPLPGPPGSLSDQQEISCASNPKRMSRP